MFNPSEAGVGTYTFTYTVDSSVACVTGEDTATFTVVVNEVDANAGEDITMTYCVTELQELVQNPQDGTDLFFSLLGEDVDQNGSFSPSIEEIVGQFIMNPIGTFTSTYTVSEGECQDTATVTIVVTDNLEANAGADTTVIFCSSEGMVDLNNFLNEDANPNGSFEGLENGMFNPSEAGVGTYTFTYTVDSSVACVTGEDSSTYTVEVIQGVSAGSDNSTEICLADVPSASGARDLFLSLLDEGVSRDGTFSPTIQDLVDQYNNVSQTGTFTTTYTVSNGECEDSAELAVTIIDTVDANAGEDVDLTFCTTEGVQNLYDFLSEDAITNGSFEGLEDGMFDPATAEIGVTTFTYTIEEGETPCASGSDSAIFTITVNEPVDANAGEAVAVEYCVEQGEDIQLTSLLTDGANLAGSFSAPFENGVFNPSTAGEGEFVITYTVDEEDCAIGTDSSTITVTVIGATEAPVADAEQSFCFVDAPTVGDIVVDGEDVVIYEDADLTTVAEDTDPLVTGASYFASFSSSAACASGVTMITVSILDSDAPTLVIEGDEFCRSDNPTVQELINNLNGNGIQIYTAVTGGTSLATTTALEDGVTYFASGTDTEGGCESSERLAVQVEVDFCGIPEGFSPNGDDINDFFVIPDIATDYPNYELEVYNRWGSLVFEGNTGTGDWDGTSNQSATLGDGVLPSGYYFYILNYNDGQTEPVQGKVYLSR